MGKQKETNEVLKEELAFIEDFSWELLSVAVRHRDYQLIKMFWKLQHVIDQKVIRAASK